MKLCNKCNEHKSLSLFSKKRASEDGLQKYCKACVTQFMLDYKRTKNGLIATIYDNQKSNSRQRGYSLPDYTMVELKRWFYLQPIQEALYSSWVDSGYEKRLRPSVDRKDDSKEYSLTNIQLMTWEQNNKKGNDDRKDGTNNKTNKEVIQMTLDGNFIQKFHSSMEASRVTGIYRTGITNCCNNKVKSAGGYTWKYSEIFSEDVLGLAS